MGRRAKNKQADPPRIQEKSASTEPSSKKLGKRKLNQEAVSTSTLKKQRIAATSDAVKSKKQKQPISTSDQSSEDGWEDVEDDEQVLPGATSFVTHNFCLCTSFDFY